jgi:PrtD family type I secretion system ABC transporter
MKPLLHLLARPLALVAGFSFVVNLLLLSPSLFMLQVFDRVLVSQSKATLLMLLLGMGFALAFTLVLDYLRSRLQGVCGNLIAEWLSPAVVRANLASAAGRAGQAPPDALRDVTALRTMFSAQGLLALFDAPWILVYVLVIWVTHPILGAAAAVAALLMLGLAVLNDRITRSGIETLQQQSAKAIRYLESSMQHAEVINALGMGDALIGRWRQQNAAVGVLQGATARKSVAMAAFTRSFRQAVQVGLQALGAYLVISGEATAGVMIATTLLLGRALAPVEQIVGSWRVLAEGRLALGRLRTLLAAADAAPPRMSLPAPTGKLQAQGLVFRQPRSERIILAGVSLELEAGQSLAVIGASGAGKSTLVRLLAGIWKPTSGIVRLDHVDLVQWQREELGPWVGYVPQDVALSFGTVAENIARMGQVDGEKVVLAAQRAGVHELVLSLPEGYDTVLDFQGMPLSPGQRQRIALARALYGTPRLLVLDEPNSNLDGAGELALAQCLKKLRGEVTVVVVTHRSTLVQEMDKLLVLEAGRVQQYGTVAEVMKAIKAAQQTAEAAAPARALEQFNQQENAA